MKCAISPDGKQVATGSYDNTLKVWDAETGVELRTLQGHTIMVSLSPLQLSCLLFILILFITQFECAPLTTKKK